MAMLQKLPRLWARSGNALGCEDRSPNRRRQACKSNFPLPLNERTGIKTHAKSLEGAHAKQTSPAASQRVDWELDAPPFAFFA